MVVSSTRTDANGSSTSLLDVLNFENRSRLPAQRAWIGSSPSRKQRKESQSDSSSSRNTSGGRELARSLGGRVVVVFVGGTSLGNRVVVLLNPRRSSTLPFDVRTLRHPFPFGYLSSSPLSFHPTNGTIKQGRSLSSRISLPSRRHPSSQTSTSAHPSPPRSPSLPHRIVQRSLRSTTSDDQEEVGRTGQAVAQISNVLLDSQLGWSRRRRGGNGGSLGDVSFSTNHSIGRVSLRIGEEDPSFRWRRRRGRSTRESCSLQARAQGHRRHSSSRRRGPRSSHRYGNRGRGSWEELLRERLGFTQVLEVGVVVGKQQQRQGEGRDPPDRVDEGSSSSRSQLGQQWRETYPRSGVRSGHAGVVGVGG